jgi:predicted PurR-regulated permease PerM
VLAFFTAIDFLAQQIPIWFDRIVEFFRRLPGMIQQAVVNLGSALGTAFGNAFNFLVSRFPVWIENILRFFRQLPGNAARALGSLGSSAGQVVNSAMTSLGRRAKSGLDNIVGFFKALPGQIQSALSSFGANVWNGMKAMINAGIRIVNRGVRSFNRLSPKDLPTIPELADGGILYHRTHAIIGEAGPEAVIPLTRPARAVELAQQSGLVDLLIRRGVVQAGSTVNRQQHHTWNIRTNKSDAQTVAQHMYRQMILSSGL